MIQDRSALDTTFGSASVRGAPDIGVSDKTVAKARKTRRQARQHKRIAKAK